VKSKTTLILLLVGVGYLIFVIYGSLVPLEFRARPFAEAWHDFQNMRYLQLGIGSRSDWVANLLLFIPLSFLWLGVFWPPRSILLKVLASLAVLAASLSLCFGIEFTQLFFPTRTVSLNDIIAETIGAHIGIVLWWLTGPLLLKWFSGWRGTHSSAALAQKICYVYLFILFAYNLLPLDLSLSPVEIYHKWKEGKVVLGPFGYAYPNAAWKWYGLIGDMAIWVPVGFLLKLYSNKSKLALLGRVILWAILLEFSQLFVYTRISDITDILTAGLGGFFGIAIAGFIYPGTKEKLPLAASAQTLLKYNWLSICVFFICFWVAVIAFVFWYPFNFYFDSEFFASRLHYFETSLLFESYYWGSEFMAITQVFRKAVFFMPLGIALGTIEKYIPHLVRRYLFAAGSFMFMMAVAFTIELGQTLLPGKHPELTDFILKTLGGVTGYLLVILLSSYLSGYSLKARSS